MTTTIRMHAVVKPGVEVEKERGWTPTIEKLYNILQEEAFSGGTPPDVIVPLIIHLFCPICACQPNCKAMQGDHADHIKTIPEEIMRLGYLGLEVQMVTWCSEGRITERELAEGITTLICPHCPKWGVSCNSREKWIARLTKFN